MTEVLNSVPQKYSKSMVT